MVAEVAVIVVVVAVIDVIILDAMLILVSFHSIKNML
jgi:hypothetical protein